MGGVLLIYLRVANALLETETNDHCMIRTLAMTTGPILKFRSLLNPWHNCHTKVAKCIYGAPLSDSPTLSLLPFSKSQSIQHVGPHPSISLQVNPHPNQLPHPHHHLNRAVQTPDLKNQRLVWFCWLVSFVQTPNLLLTTMHAKDQGASPSKQALSNVRFIE